MVLVAVADQGAVRAIEMRRPEARNAMNTALLAGLLEAVTIAADDPDVRVVVLAGAGGSFSAGADVREALDREGQVRRMELFCEVYEAITSCPKPTIAAVTGHCVGGGAEVAAACDLRVADPTAQFRFPGAALGFPVGAAKLIGLVGLGTAKDFVLTARSFGAEEGLRVGFVQRAAPEGEALVTALAVAEDIARNHPDAVAFLKRQFNGFSGLRDRVAVENDGLRALAEAGGDYGQLARPRGR